MNQPDPNARPAPPSSIKETLTSIIIAFALAFVFRGFVVEAFIIPTGSMAPTLLGAHIRVRNADSGSEWTVNPWDYADPRTAQAPLPIQGRPDRRLAIHDPMTKERIERWGLERMAGDRIFVLKYLDSIFEASRWDVVVFKNPRNPQENYIKRLVGLPGEQLALIDGDLFTRSATDAAADAGKDPWLGQGWSVRRKPRRAQDTVWQTVFSSEFTPLGRSFRSPWVARGGTWTIDERRSYAAAPDPSAPAELRDPAIEWDLARWPLTDRYPYNETPAFAPMRTDNRLTGGLPTNMGTLIFPVADLRLRAAVEPTGDAPAFPTALIAARGHEFRAVASAAGVALEMRAAPATPPDDSGWKRLTESPLPAGAFATGRATTFEFEHVDQTLRVLIDGRQIAEAGYDWTPAERIEHTFGRPLAGLLAEQGEGSFSVFANSDLYRKPAAVRLSLSGGPATLSRVGLDRDLYYQPAQASGTPAAGSHPSRSLILGPDHFFVCGDNSPASDDSRMWSFVDPWVAEQIDDTIGVVPRDLLIGKAFFVYFPSVHTRFGLPIPDFGRMRFIF